MSDFMTEKEIEDLLVRETRSVEGAPHPVTAMRSLWVSLDCIQTMSNFTVRDIVGLTKMSMKEQGYSFTEAFEAVIAFTHREIRNTQI